MRHLILLCCVILLVVPASVAYYGYNFRNRMLYRSLFGDGIGDARERMRDVRERMRKSRMFRYPFRNFYRLFGEALYDA